MELIPPELVDEMAVVYRDADKAIRRTNSRPAVDGGRLLLALLDEARATRRLLEALLGERGKRP